MEETPYPLRAHQNLRVYQLANELATDLHWVTRRFPQKTRFDLTDQVRRAAWQARYHIVVGWKRRYEGPAFRRHLGEAQSACARMSLWLHLAHENCYLADDAHRRLQARIAEVQQWITRLNEQRIPMLAGGAMPALA